MSSEHHMPPCAEQALDEKPSIAIILPAYNEESTIEATIESFHAVAPEAAIYVINNNSSDNTEGAAKKKLMELGAPGAVINERRQGKGNAVRRAFLEVEADIYVMADADCTYPADQLWELVNPVASGQADVVVGDRHSEGDYARENTRPLHDFGNKLVQFLVNMVCASNFTDIMSGYRAMSRSFVRSYPLMAEGFQIETEMSIFAAQGRFRCLEVPVRYQDRPCGSFSKLHTFRDGFRVLLAIFNIIRFYKPLAFFSVLAMLVSLCGFAIGFPVILEYARFHYIYKVPTAILAASVQILAVLLFCVGLILDVMAYHRRLDMEAIISRNHNPGYTPERPSGRH